ncbi:hypothetical protein SISNIDRAFT_487566 [Sistotremastrum niveocremeum HHB9708]|uniref:Secreted protein n=1 Tax=Sistotremastrum niveocremeum HHB9708 TaxID=1314777 RepID=A0A164S884_9AGAM|nr:hypothetical protein SISNIDRAFT_487566 [Sistotremastrum niveocremeum HHB9708]
MSILIFFAIIISGYVTAFEIAGCPDAILTSSQLLFDNSGQMTNVTQWSCGKMPQRISQKVPSHARDFAKRWSQGDPCPSASITCVPPQPPPPPRSPVTLADCRAWATELATNPTDFTVDPQSAMVWVGSPQQTCIWVLVNTASTPLTWSTSTASLIGLDISNFCANPPLLTNGGECDISGQTWYF